MITAFGFAATRYAQHAGDLEAIVAEPAFVSHAYAEAVLRRERGETFYGMLLIDDAITRSVVELAPTFLATYPDDDTRREIFRKLSTGHLTMSGKPPSEWFAKIDASMQQLAMEFYQLCDAMLVRSFAEYERLRAFQFRPRPFERIVVVPEVPPVVASRAGRPSSSGLRRFRRRIWAHTPLASRNFSVTSPSSVPAAKHRPFGV